MRVGYSQRPGSLPPLGGVLWRLHKGNWEVREDRNELDKKVSVISGLFTLSLLLFYTSSRYSNACFFIITVPTCSCVLRAA